MYSYIYIKIDFVTGMVTELDDINESEFATVFLCGENVRYYESPSFGCRYFRLDLDLTNGNLLDTIMYGVNNYSLLNDVDKSKVEEIIVRNIRNIKLDYLIR